MTNEEMIRQYYNGDDGILEKLFKANVGMIHRLAKDVALAFHCYHMDSGIPDKVSEYTRLILEELYNEGSLAFVECIHTKEYDPEQAKLTTYLHPYIKGAMYRWMERNLGSISVGSNVMAQIRKAQEMYCSDCQSFEDIAKSLDVSVETVKQYVGYNTHFLSFYDLLPDDAEEHDPLEYLFSSETVVSAEDIVYDKIVYELLEELFNELPHKQRDVLGHSYGVFGYEKMTIDALSLKMMMTPSGVTRARLNALKMMKKLYFGSNLYVWQTACRSVRKAARDCVT